MSRRKKKHNGELVLTPPIEVQPEEIINTPIPETATAAIIEAVEAKIEPQPTQDSIITDKYLKLVDVVRRLPEAKMVPTDRWYGETFFPKYSDLLKTIRVLTD